MIAGQYDIAATPVADADVWTDAERPTGSYSGATHNAPIAKSHVIVVLTAPRQPPVGTRRLAESLHDPVRAV